MFKRFFLFFGVNILIVVTISTVLSLLGVGNYHIAGGGINLGALAVFCLVRRIVTGKQIGRAHV